MKKFLCLLLTVVLLCAVASAATQDMREVLNPENYILMEVYDTWFDDDGNEYIVQGTLGDLVYEYDDNEPVAYGFEPEDAQPFVLAPDAQIMMPDENGVNVPVTVDELFAYCDTMREAGEWINFYCSFELSENGVVTMLAYEPKDAQVLPDAGNTASAEYYNPNGYGLLMVYDAYLCDDGDYVVQGCFGDWDYTDEANARSVGFADDVFTITLAPDAEIEMSANLDDEDNIPMTVDEFMDLVAEVSAEFWHTFYCEFAFNDAGVLTKLVYVYLPY